MKLIIRNVSLADSGQYKCVASNRAGQSFHKFDLDILCRHLSSEFCRQLEHAHILAYRHEHERRLHAQETRAAHARELALGKGRRWGGGPKEQVLKIREQLFSVFARTRKHRKHRTRAGPKPLYAEYAMRVKDLRHWRRTRAKLYYDSLNLEPNNEQYTGAKHVRAYAPAVGAGQGPRVNIVRARLVETRKAKARGRRAIRSWDGRHLSGPLLLRTLADF